MSEESPRWLGARDIADRVAAAKLKPQASVDSHLDAIRRLDGRLHAYVHVDADARAAAGPLSGVTLAVKDTQPVAGMPWTYGTPSWRDKRASEDAVPVMRARAAGMTVLGKTNLPELAAAIGTTNAMFPPTHNPWRQGITPGGSSGGSAAAVAAGLATVAMGDDMGGSIRIPSSCCGVVGLRPSPDRVPAEMIDSTGLSSRGPIGRTVADVRMLYSTVTGAALERNEVRKPYRIGIVDASPLAVDAPCREACRRAAQALRSLGHDVSAIDWDPQPVADGYMVVRRASVASFPVPPDQLGPGVRGLAEEGHRLSAVDYLRAFESASSSAARAVAKPLRSGFDFLLTPTLGMPPMKIEDVPTFLGGDWSRYTQFVLPVSFARVPALSLPAGLHDGLPVGVQLVGRMGAEAELLDLAEQLEAQKGFGYQRPPGLD